MTEVERLIAKARTIATAAVTYLVALSAALVVLADELGDVAGGDVTAWITRAVAWLGTAIAIIRRVTPVEPEQRGLVSDAS